MDLLHLSSYEQTLVNYWVECGTAISTSGGLAPVTWNEVDAWAKRFYTEQYVEWVETPRPLRADGLPDERYRTKPIPLLATHCLLSDWELQMIRRMSQEYVSAYADTNPLAPCPKEVVIEDLTIDDKLANANAFLSAAMSLFGNTENKE